MVVAIDFAQPLAQGVGVVAAVADAVQELADLTPEAGAGPAEVRFQNLPDVHARGHAQRIEHDVDRGAVLQRRHVLDRHDARDHALVAVPAGHLVAGLELALHSHEDLDHLHDAGRQLVAALQLLDLVLEPVLASSGWRRVGTGWGSTGSSAWSSE